ncbi:MAG: PD-(D/E)XK nuclease family protein [Burkholderiales bacterium]|nr:PD-(D/E)XK nuclease family protein [Burkholderiales bacterium]
MTVIDAAFDEALNHVLDPRSCLRPQPWLWHAGVDAQTCWAEWARTAASWLQEQGVSPRDAVVIVPVGAVLSHARRAWAEQVGGWAPPVETIASLISAQGWRHEGGHGTPGRVSLDVVADRLQVSQRLAKEPWCRQWVARDPRGFDHAMTQVVDAAHTWVRRAQAIAPGQRASYWERLRGLLGVAATSPVQYGSREKLLLAWTLEWVIDSLDAGLPSDLLFDLPSKAYIGVSAGESVSPGTEAHLMLSVMAQATAKGVPCLWSVAQGAWGDADAQQRSAQPAQIACTDAEDEARHATAFILEAVNASRRVDGEPVALIALDRSLVRRVRAMLDGAGAQVADETGWRLSTTRAAAVVTRLLQAAHPQASSDDLLDWLKSGWVQLDKQDAGDELEAWCRRHAWLRAWDKPALPAAGGASCPDAALQLWQQADQLTQAFRSMRSGKKRPLRVWLQTLLEMLQQAQAWDSLTQDEAGALVAETLHLSHPDLQDDSTWQQLLDQMQLDGVRFGRWVHEVLENTTFRPQAPSGRIDVVITPMARAVMRPFHSIFIPGADSRQLGGVSTSTTWLGPALTRQMALATPEDLRQAQWEAFGLLMSRERVVCLHRQGQGTEPMEASPWLTRWVKESQCEWQTVPAPWQVQHVDAALAQRPLPHLDQDSLALLPTSLSATSYEALRQCPYRFYAQSVLRLRDVDELEEGLDRSDYGTWLHEVIRRFHVQREQMLALRTQDEDVQAWLEVADVVMKDMGLTGDATRPYFLPYRSVLPAMASAYVRWLHAHEQDGWRCVDNESSQHRSLDLNEQCGQIEMKGQIDRIDASYRDGQRARMVIDYKSGSLLGLKERVKRPLEDTQLPFYAALMGGDVSHAAYLHLDAKAATLIRHEDVQAHAEQLMDGLVDDFTRIKQGVAMPALGDAAACTYCAARGLCRKDHWPLSLPNEGAQA